MTPQERVRRELGERIKWKMEVLALLKSELPHLGDDVPPDVFAFYLAGVQPRDAARQYLREYRSRVTRQAHANQRIYLASSWRNTSHDLYLTMLRGLGYEVYDYRNPKPGDNGFHWSEIDPRWEEWNLPTYHQALNNPLAIEGFHNDFEAMQQADLCVLLLPSGRSAHLEAGFFVGAGKPLYIVLTESQQPELMYKMATKVCIGHDELLRTLDRTPRNAVE